MLGSYYEQIKNVKKNVILFSQHPKGSTPRSSSSGTETRRSSHAHVTNTTTASHRKHSFEKTPAPAFQSTQATSPSTTSITQNTSRKKSKKKVSSPSKLRTKVSRNSKLAAAKPLQTTTTKATASIDEQVFQQTLRNGSTCLDQSHAQKANHNNNPNDRSNGDGFYDDTGLRWDNVCDDPLDELRRIETYKANRRLRYINANNAKIALLTIKERKF